MMADSCGRPPAGGVARRRRERRLRSWFRHEQQTVAMFLATLQHHSAPREQTKARSSLEEEPGGGLPAPLSEVAGRQEVLVRHVVEDLRSVCPVVQILDLPVPHRMDHVAELLNLEEDVLDAGRLVDRFLQVPELVIEVPKISLDVIPLRALVPEPQLAEQLVEVPTIVSFSSLQRTIEQTVDIPVPPWPWPSFRTIPQGDRGWPGAGCGSTSRTTWRRSGSPTHQPELLSLEEEPGVGLPGPLSEVAGRQEVLVRHVVEDLRSVCPVVQILDRPVPQLVDNVLDALRILERQMAVQVVEVPQIHIDVFPARSLVPEPQRAELLVEVPTVLSPTRIALQIAEQIVDTPVPQGRVGKWRVQGFLPEQSSTATSSCLERISERTAEQIVGIPSSGGGLGHVSSSSAGPADDDFTGFFRTFLR